MGRMRVGIISIVAVGCLFTLGTAARATTITVSSLADPSATGACTLHDAIVAANTMTATNDCAAGSGSDTIQFSVIGTIALASTLPEITDNQLTIKGPCLPGITISGGGKVQVMQVASGATLNLKNLKIADGLGESPDATGGIINEGTLTVTNSTFSGNSAAPFEIPGDAGAITNSGALTVIKSTFSDNNAGANTGIVGGIFNQGSLTIINSTFSGNRMARNSGDGGIFSLGMLTVTNSTFSHNIGDGTGAIDNRGTATITNSTFSNNFGGVDGGQGGGGFSNGIRFVSSSATASITNSTFSGNTGISGNGAILNGMGSTLTVTNSTLSGIQDTDRILNYGIFMVKGTILATCVPAGVFKNIAITDLGYNISPDNSCALSETGSHNSTDPKLDPVGLRNNGGPTATIALISGSPAIDAVPLDSCTDQDGSPLKRDQRGFSRPDAGEDVCDIGAYEFQDFAGQPGRPNCRGKSVSALVQQFGDLDDAAEGLGFPSVKALQNAISAFCRG